MALLGNAASGNQVLAQDLLASVVASSYLISGTTPSTSANLTLTYGAQEAVVTTASLAQYVKLAASTLAITASKDTYVDLGYSGTFNGGVANGTLTKVEVANGAAAPAITANSLRLWKVVSSGTAITAVTLLAPQQPVQSSQLLVPACRAYNSVNFSVASSGTWTAVSLDSTRFDQGVPGLAAQHSTTSNTSRLTCQVAGVYQISGGLSWAVNGTGLRGIALRLNGATFIAGHTIPTTNTDAQYQNVSTLWSLSVSDYVELMAVQSSGGALFTYSTNAVAPELMWVRVA